MTWEDLLVALEAELAALEADATDDVAGLLAAWSPPAEIGPLPDELRGRARAVLDRINVVTAELARRRDEVGGEIDGLTQRRQATRAYVTAGTLEPGC